MSPNENVIITLNKLIYYNNIRLFIHNKIATIAVVKSYIKNLKSKNSIN